MYKIKTISYDVDPKVTPEVEILEERYATSEEAERAATKLAEELCNDLNVIGRKHSNYFEVGSYEEVYLPGGVICPYYPVSVLWYDHAPDDRMNDCDIRIVAGYEIIQEN